MIITLNDKKDDALVLTKLVPKRGMIKEIEDLHVLYSTPDFQRGYLQHGELLFHSEIPKKEVLITDEDIQVYNTHTWGTAPINNRYPIEHYTTKAKNTLIVIREVLELERGHTFSMRNFFIDSSKEVTPYGFIKTGKFDLLMQVKKLRYLLENPELALSLLKDAYLDFNLFVDFLTKVDFEILPTNPNLFELLHGEATENTELLTIAKEFTKLKQ
jgi:hypothetical protein